MSKRKQAAGQFRKAMQFYTQTLTDDEAMEVSSVYPKYKIGEKYEAGEMFTDGENAVGDPQLYRVVQAHTSQQDWKPSETPSLYTPIGLTEEGYPIWSQPTGSHDAYNKGDIVDFEGTLVESTIDGNVWSPKENPDGWKVYEE